jgi:hypothetical protein
VRARRSRSSRPPRGSGRTQPGESVARALAARRNGLLIRIQRYPKFPFCASELSYDCAKYVDWPRAVYRLQRDAIWPALVDGPLSLQVRRTANSWGEPNEDPIQFLEYVMESRGLTRKDLEPYLGSRTNQAMSTLLWKWSCWWPECGQRDSAASDQARSVRASPSPPLR